MNEAFAPAIAALQHELQEIEKKAREIKSAINTLFKHAGEPEPYSVADNVISSGLTSIRADTFYGKTIGTAAREYLEMRKSANQGPTSTREIYEALVQGGLQFDTANETNALISLSSTLRKNSKMFHKLPNGQYGLLAWYPNAKPAKIGKDDESPDQTKSAPSTTPDADLSQSDASPVFDDNDAS